MYYDAILFSDSPLERLTPSTSIPSRSAGAYTLASYLRHNGYTVKVIDFHLYFLGSSSNEKLTEYVKSIIGPQTLFMGFSSTFSLYKNKERIENLICFISSIKSKHPHIKILLGGYGSETYSFFKKHQDGIDMWLKGLGEDTVLDYMKKRGEGFSQIVTDPFSKNFDFRNKKYTFFPEDHIFENEVLSIEVARGCRFKCKFCKYPLLGRKPSDNYTRSEDSLYSEFMHNYENFGTTNYRIVDDTFNETTEKIQTFANAVKRTGLDLNFWSYCRIELMNSYPEQISILRDLGLKYVFFGLESLNYESAKAIGKGLTLENILKTLSDVKKSWGEYSILHANFIVGLPYETRETLDKWTRMVFNGETDLDHVRFTSLNMVSDSDIANANFSGEYFSTFELNKEKYGYVDIGEGDWKNENWTSEEAKMYTEYLNAAAVQNSLRRTFSEFQFMNVRIKYPNLTWNDLHQKTYTLDEEQSIFKKINDASNYYLKTYEERVMS